MKMKTKRRERERANLTLAPLTNPGLQLLRSGAVDALEPILHIAPKSFRVTRMAPTTPATSHRQNLGIKINLPFTPAERAVLIHLLEAHEAVIRPRVVTVATAVHFKVYLVAHDLAAIKVELVL